MTNGTSETGPVAVLGATGQQGGAVVDALLERGGPVRAVVRDRASARARALRGRGVDVVHADLRDAESVRAAFAGARAVFSVQPSSGQPGVGVSDEDEVALGVRVADAAQLAGVGHLVYSSAIAVGAGVTGIGHFDTKRRVEARVRELDLAWSIVRPATFMEMLLPPGSELDHGPVRFFMRPDQPMQFVAARDIGRVVATMVADTPRYGGRTLELAGDAPTGRSLAASLSAAAGRPITYERLPAQVLADPMLARLATLVDEGPLAGRASLEALRTEFPFLLDVDAWLRGPGAPLLSAAVETEGGAVSRR